MIVLIVTKKSRLRRAEFDPNSVDLHVSRNSRGAGQPGAGFPQRCLGEMRTDHQ